MDISNFYIKLKNKEDILSKIPLNKVVEYEQNSENVKSYINFIYDKLNSNEYYQAKKENDSYIIHDLVVSSFLIDNKIILENDKRLYEMKDIKHILKNKMNQTHYFKWSLTENLSVRFFINFQDNQDLNGKYVLKDHSNKKTIQITEEMAHELIESSKEELIPQEILGLKFGKIYRKIIL